MLVPLSSESAGINNVPLPSAALRQSFSPSVLRYNKETAVNLLGGVVGVLSKMQEIIVPF